MEVQSRPGRQKCAQAEAPPARSVRRLERNTPCMLLASPVHAGGGVLTRLESAIIGTHDRSRVSRLHRSQAQCAPGCVPRLEADIAGNLGYFSLSREGFRDCAVGRLGNLSAERSLCLCRIALEFSKLKLCHETAWVRQKAGAVNCSCHERQGDSERWFSIVIALVTSRAAASKKKEAFPDRRRTTCCALQGHLESLEARNAGCSRTSSLVLVGGAPRQGP